MINTFLRAKHWQIFLLLFGMSFLFQIINMIIIQNSNTSNLGGKRPYVMIFVITLFFSWLWSIGIGLQSKIPSTIKMKVGKFKIFFFIPLVYIICVMLLMSFMLNGLKIENATSNPGTIFGIIAVIFPLHAFSMFCIMYILYFVSKTIKTAELQRETHFSDFAGEFFLMLFYPIGIWIIQPRINKLVEEVES